MQYTLFEDSARFSLLPLTFTRPVFDLRIGIYTFQERWNRVLDKNTSSHAYGYLNTCKITEETTLWINGRVAPNKELLRLSKEVTPGQYYVNSEDDILMFLCPSHIQKEVKGGVITAHFLETHGFNSVQVDLEVLKIERLTDLFTKVRDFIVYDFDMATSEQNGKGAVSDAYTKIYGPENVYVAPGAKVEASVIHAEDGPVYIGPEAHIQIGSLIYGVHCFGEKVTVAMGSKLRGNTCVGPHAKVGGEVKNCYVGAYTNKGHEGYLGNSVLGNGCNMGADTNVSNMKNTLGNVRQWSYEKESMIDTGMTFCGTMMGDYSRCAINSMLNTGTVAGVSAHIFGSGFPPKFIPSFSWGGAGKMETYRFESAVMTLKKLLGLKGKVLAQNELDILKAVYKLTAAYRSWEPSS